MTGVAAPPDAATRIRLPRKSAENTIVPSLPHAPPRGVGASAMRAHGTSRDVGDPQLARREEGDLPAVGRPEREERGLGSRQGCRDAGSERLIPEPAARAEDHARAVGRQRERGGDVAGELEVRLGRRNEERMDGLRPHGTLPEEKPAQRERRERERGCEGPRQTARAADARPTAAGGIAMPACEPSPIQRSSRFRSPARLPALLGILRETGPHDAVERGRRGRLDLRDRLRLVAQDRRDERGLALARERLLARSPSRRAPRRRRRCPTVASASFPSSCSGDMYWKVPRIVPSCVRFCAVASSVGSDVAPEAGVAAAIPFASPKSSSFTPDFVSITLPGFRSRCTIPCRCAFSSASAISCPKRSVCSSGRLPFASRSDRVSPSRYSMTRYSVSPSLPTS